MRLRPALVILIGAGYASALSFACSASSGEPIPPEVYDAEALDVGSSISPADGSRPAQQDATAPTDGGPGETDADVVDAPIDVRADAPTSKVVRINEIYVERGGGGAQNGYVELRGPEGTPVDNLFLRLIDRNGKASPATGIGFDVGSAGEKIGASGTWVIGGALANGRVDRIVTNPQGWGLDTKGAVQLLVGASREVVDVVGWTTEADGGTVPQPATAPKATGEGNPYVLPDTAAVPKSFGRAATGADTDDNKTDFCTMARTCGAANAACE